MTGSIWTDLLLFAVFIGLLSIGMFRLDTIIASNHSRPEPPRKNLCKMDDSGRIVLLDPDGHEVRRRTRG